MLASGNPTWPGEQFFAFPIAMIVAALYLIWRIRSLHREPDENEPDRRKGEDHQGSQ